MEKLTGPDKPQMKIGKVILNTLVLLALSTIIYFFAGILLNLILSLVANIPVIKWIIAFILASEWGVFLLAILATMSVCIPVMGAMNKNTPVEAQTAHIIVGGVFIILGAAGLIISFINGAGWRNADAAIGTLGALLIFMRKI